MVRGLVIRQAFILFDIVLALLAITVGGMVLMQILSPPERIEVTGEIPAETQAANTGIANVGDLAAYSGINSSKLFGQAGSVPPDTPHIEPEGEIEEPTLNLKLIGTIALSPSDPFATAFIENEDDKGSGAQAYALGEEVTDKVKLLEVRQREIIVLNERNSPPSREKYTMEEPKEGETEPETVKMAAPKPAPSGGTNQIDLNRQELVQDLYANYADLVTRVKPRLVTDSSGKVSGITADNIGDIPMAQKLGLTNNDVLQTVNNEKIDSEQKILEIMQKYRNASSFRIGIMREGKPQILTYRLN
jgi:type II secretory pathway component PulC